MISVIVPVHNGCHEIEKCLEALTHQDYSGKMEIIVVNDGSTDNTAETIHHFRGVKIVTQAHKGPAAARNAGVRHAGGDIILFTDADCVPELNWVTEMAKPFSDTAIAGVQGVYTTHQKELMARFTQIEIEDRYERMKGFAYVDFIGTYAAGYRRDVFERLNGFDESFPAASGEDSEFSYRLSRAGHRMILNDMAIVRHEHPSSLRRYLAVKFWRAYWRIPLYRKHAGKIVRDSYTPQGLKTQIGLFYTLLAAIGFSAFIGNGLIPLGVYVLLAVSTVPFSLRVLRKDRNVGIASFVVLQMRSAVFALGLVAGLVLPRQLKTTEVAG